MQMAGAMAIYYKAGSCMQRVHAMAAGNFVNVNSIERARAPPVAYRTGPPPSRLPTLVVSSTGSAHA